MSIPKISGFKKDSLLKAFEQTVALMGKPLENRYGKDFAGAFKAAVLNE